MAIIGIDLGTTNSLIAQLDSDGLSQIIHNKEGANLTPSVVWSASLITQLVCQYSWHKFLRFQMGIIVLVRFFFFFIVLEIILVNVEQVVII